ncbi:unnamed protein product [Sphagnum balticum]
MRRSVTPTATHNAEFLHPPSLHPSSSSAFTSAGQRFLQPCISSSLAFDCAVRQILAEIFDEFVKKSKLVLVFISDVGSFFGFQRAMLIKI